MLFQNDNIASKWRKVKYFKGSFQFFPPEKQFCIYDILTLYILFLLLFYKFHISSSSSFLTFFFSLTSLINYSHCLLSLFLLSLAACNSLVYEHHGRKKSEITEKVLIIWGNNKNHIIILSGNNSHFLISCECTLYNLIN